MTTTMDRVSARPPAVTVTPVLDGDRAVGAWIIGPDGVTYRPVVDLPLLAGTVLATAGAAAVAAAAILAAARHRPAIGAVTMGPGGWVSVKGMPKPPLRQTKRPWWARLLKAQPLTATARR